MISGHPETNVPKLGPVLARPFTPWFALVQVRVHTSTCTVSDGKRTSV